MLCYRSPRRVFLDRTKQDVLSELDYLGTLLYTAGVALLLLGLRWPASGVAWRSGKVIASVTMGGVMLALTAAWDASRITQKTLVCSQAVPKFQGLLVAPHHQLFIRSGPYCSEEPCAPTIQLIFTSNPATAGRYNVPSEVGTAFGGIIVGALVTNIRYISLQLVMANVIEALSCGLLAIVTPHRVAEGLAIQAFANLPFSWTLIICYTTAGLHVPQRDIGLALGFLSAVRYLGGVIGSTVLNTIFRAETASKVPKRITQAVMPFGFPASKIGGHIAALSSGESPDSLAKVPLDVRNAAVEAMRWGYSGAFKYIWYASVPFFIVACIVSVFVLDPSSYFTNHLAVASARQQHTTEPECQKGENETEKVEIRHVS